MARAGMAAARFGALPQLLRPSLQAARPVVVGACGIFGEVREDSSALR